MNAECLKLTAYFGERDRAGGRLLADVLLDACERHRMVTSVLLRGAEGFGAHHGLSTDRLLSRSEDLPGLAIAIVVDARTRVEALAAEVAGLGPPGMLTLERAWLYAAPPVVPEALGGETKLTVYFGRRARIDGTPAFAAVCALLARHRVAGATALLGVDGTSHGRRVRARFFHGNAEVPMAVIAVGPERRVAAATAELATRLERPLMTLERVRVCRRDGVALAAPEPAAVEALDNAAGWQKLTVYSSEASRHAGVPLHQALIRRLRAAGAAGATRVRGVWGFHGDHPPHGDRLLALRRHVPVVTTVIDRPERIAALFADVAAVTACSGLVTSEMVPVLRRP